MTVSDALDTLDAAWAKLRRLEGADTFSGHTAHQLATVIAEVKRRYLVVQPTTEEATE